MIYSALVAQSHGSKPGTSELLIHPLFRHPGAAPHFPEDRPFKRNSEFVKFFSGALKENVGDYAPLKMFVFDRV